MEVDNPSIGDQTLWVGRTFGEMLIYAHWLATQAETALSGGLLAAAGAANKRRGRPMSRRVSGGWYPGIDADRKRIGWLDKAIGNAARGRWGPSLKWAARAGIDVSGDFRVWVISCKEQLAATKRRKQGQRRMAWATVHHGRWVRLKKAALVGDAASMARAFRGKRDNGILREVEVTPGRWASGATDVQAAATDYFDSAFAGKERSEQPLRALLADSDSG
jgi:hypothetical protein